MVYVRPNTRPHIFNRSALKIDALNREGVATSGQRGSDVLITSGSPGASSFALMVAKILFLSIS